MSKTLKRILMATAGAAVLAGAGTYGWYWYDTGRFLESTNDAYVQADYTTIAPKVSGYISAVAVEDNQQVKAGDVLARIDDRDYRTALARPTPTSPAPRPTSATSTLSWQSSSP
jgi:membrane fusion protein, multidrug efflux system